MLTGKARTDFEKWLDEQKVAPYRSIIWDTPIIVLYSYLEDFLATVNIYLLIEYHEHLKQFSGKVKELSENLRIDLGVYKDRENVRKDAIAKANEIYNKVYK